MIKKIKKVSKKDKDNFIVAKRTKVVTWDPVSGEHKPNAILEENAEGKGRIKY